jgi:hypothetical protein
MAHGHSRACKWAAHLHRDDADEQRKRREGCDAELRVQQHHCHDDAYWPRHEREGRVAHLLHIVRVRGDEIVDEATLELGARARRQNEDLPAAQGQ